MFLRKTKRNGRTYLSAVHGYKTKDGKSRAKTIKSFGYVDVLEKEFDDPIAHFTEVTKQMDLERKANESIEISFKANEMLDLNESSRKNFGYVVLSNLYHYLEIDYFINNRRRYEKFKFNANAIMKLLVYSRLLYPASKKNTVELKDRFFDKFDFKLHDVYDALDFFAKHRDALQEHLHKIMVEKEKRGTDLLYYDVTNYYYESDVVDEIRKYGPSKEKKKRPIIQMGLALDESGLPVSYKLFEGNTHDSQTLFPILGEIRRKYDTKRIIVVADKGLNSGDNIAFSTIQGCGYVFSKSLRNASKKLKDYALNGKDFKETYDENGDLTYKMKSRVIENEINVSNVEIKSKRKVKLEQKEVVFYSEKFAKRAKKKREEILEKSRDMVANPSKYTKATSYGATAYIKEVKFDKDTGEVNETDSNLHIDEDFIKEQEKYDGYYVIVSSELDKPAEEIVNIYKGLWKIEDTFKVTKSTLEARPVYVRNREHIEAHFLICFISLLIGRLLEKKLDNKYSINKIIEALKNISCTHIKENYYLFDYRDEITDALEAVFNVGLGKKIMTKKEILAQLAKTKKVD